MLTELITMLAYFRKVKYFLESIEQSWNVVYAMILIMSLCLSGLTMFNMVQYGFSNLKYNNFGTAFLYSIYDPAFLFEGAETKNHSLHEFIFFIINITIYCLVWQLLVFALFVAVMFDSYRNIVIAKGDPNKKEKTSIKKTFFELVLWTLSWLPERAYKPLVQWTKKKEANKKSKDNEDEDN